MGMLKIRPIGNSLGVVLPKDVLSRLNLGAGDEIFLTEAPDGSMRITRYDPDFGKQIDAARQGMKTYRNTLRELAK